MPGLRNRISYSTTPGVASLLATREPALSGTQILRLRLRMTTSEGARNDEKESALTGIHRLGTPGLCILLESVGVLWYYRSDYTERRLI